MESKDKAQREELACLIQRLLRSEALIIHAAQKNAALEYQNRLFKELSEKYGVEMTPNAIQEC